jgi:hypothetical protein
MWHVAGNVGMAAKGGEAYSCNMGAGCARDHTTRTPTQWAAILTKSDMREWRVSYVMKQQFGNSMPGFDTEWL